MDIRKRVVPNNHLGDPITSVGEREFIFFKVKFNNFRDVSGSTANEVTDREEWDECECCLCLPENYSEDGEPTQLAIYCHGAGGRVCEETNMKTVSTVCFMKYRRFPKKLVAVLKELYRKYW